MLVTTLALLLAGPATVSIYVGPVVRGGFSDVDKGVLDSVADLRVSIARDRRFRVVAKAADAQIELLVVGRDKTSQGTMMLNTPGTSTYYPGQTLVWPGGGTTQTPGTVITTPGISIPVPIDKPHVVALLRVGEYDRPLVATAGTWGGCAKQLLKDVAAWVEANRHNLEEPGA